MYPNIDSEIDEAASGMKHTGEAAIGILCFNMTTQQSGMASQSGSHVFYTEYIMVLVREEGSMGIMAGHQPFCDFYLQDTEPMDGRESSYYNPRPRIRSLQSGLFAGTLK